MTIALQPIIGQPQTPRGAPRVRLSATGPLGLIQCETMRVVTLIGGRRDCDLPLPDPDISKVHCALVHTDRGLLICDLRSRTGTRLNEALLRVAPLRPGDRVKVGTIPIDLEWLSPESTDPADAPADGVTLATGAATGVAAAAQESSADGDEAVIELDYLGQARRFVAPAILLGHRSSCNLVLDSPDVSLAHALIFRLAGRVVICDLGSRSGTLCNGMPIELAYLTPGDVLALADCELRLSAFGDQLAAPADAPSVSARPARGTPALAAVAFSSRATAPLAGHAPGGPRPALAPSAPHAPNAPLAVPALRAGALPVSSTPVTPAANLPTVAAWPNELTEIETSLAALHERIAGARQQLDLERAALVTQNAEMHALRGDLARRQTELEERSQQLTTRAAVLEQEAAARAAAEQELAEFREHLAADAAELEARHAEWSQRSQELEQRATDVEQGMRELEARQADLAEMARQREAELQRLAAQLHERESALAEREAAEQQAASQINRFAAFLQETSAALSKAAQPGDPPQATQSSATAGGETKVKNTLPAPMVAKPIFAIPAVSASAPVAGLAADGRVADAPPTVTKESDRARRPDHNRRYPRSGR